MNNFDFKSKKNNKKSPYKSQRQLKVGEELRHLISKVLLKETFTMNILVIVILLLPK